VVNNETKRNGTITPTAAMTPGIPSEVSMRLGEGDLDVVRGVLTLPGIVGFACLDRIVPLQVYSWDSDLVIQKSEQFVNNVTQVLRSMPSEFYQLEFGFGSYSVGLRRFVTGDAIALVMQAGMDLQGEEARLAAFCQVMMQNRSGVLAEIESHQLMRQRMRQGMRQGNITGDASIAQVTVDAGPSVPRSLMIHSFNRLAEIAGRYLGSAIMVRHLHRSRPRVACLESVTIDRAGKLAMPAEMSGAEMSGIEGLTPEQRSAFTMWVQEFVQHCSKIIRNFDRMARQEGLTEEEIAVLFPEPQEC
jgi:hypothetical protein